MRLLIGLLMAGYLIVSCHRIIHKAEEVTSNTATGIGDQVGKRSTEFVSGVKDGVDKVYGCTVDVSPALKAKGISLGKFVIDADTGTRNKNKLSVYIIAANATDMVLTAKITDSKGLEYGRTTAKLKSAAGSAHFVDLIFDQRTDIEGRSKIVLE